MRLDLNLILNVAEVYFNGNWLSGISVTMRKLSMQSKSANVLYIPTFSLVTRSVKFSACDDENGHLEVNGCRQF